MEMGKETPIVTPRRHRGLSGLAIFGLLLLLVTLAMPGMADDKPKKDGEIPPDAAVKASTGEAKRIVREGIAIEFAVEPVAQAENGQAGLMEGKDAHVRFTLTDAATGAPLKGLYPAAWMDPRKLVADGPAMCSKKISSFKQGLFAFRPKVDLNSWYALTMNTKASISVIDPLVDFSGQKLLAMVLLKSPGEDWVLSSDSMRLFVTLPRTNHVAVIDTIKWRVVNNIEVGPKPVRIAFQPDEKYLWVGNDGDEKGATESGVTVIDRETLKVAARIKTGNGHHEITFSDDDRYAFVSNQEAGTVSIIDIRKLKPIKHLETGLRPASIDYSSLAKAAYVVNEGSGTITVIDGNSHEILSQIEVKPGVKSIRFAPGGRWAFILNPVENTVGVVDVSVNRVVHLASIGQGPDQVAFTETYAYIRSSGSAKVGIIPLAQLGKTARLPMTLIPGGQKPADKASSRASAAAIVPTPNGDSVLITNPLDKTVYYYMEGMSAPMGNFHSFLREPKAVLVVDRSIQETAPGVYSTTITLPPRDVYDIAFLLDTPRVAHCFTATVKANPSLQGAEGEKFDIEFLLKERKVQAGETNKLRFKLTDKATGKSRGDVKDFRVLSVLVPGTWQRRGGAEPVSDGIYEVALPFPRAGLYYVYFESKTLGKRFNEMPYLILRAEEHKPGQKGRGG